MKKQNHNNQLTYKIVGDYNICGKDRTCLIRLCANETDAKAKLNEVLENKIAYCGTDIKGNPYIIVENDDGDEWYYGYTD